MSSIPDNLKYTKDHEWIRLEEDGTVTVGVTDYAQNSLGDITFVELPEVDDTFEAGDSFGVVESVKAASDLYMPVQGTIRAVNDELTGAPETVNSDPYGEAWMIRVQLDEGANLDDLMDAAAYANIVG
ncbi:glycine cleavage system protein GcvH [Puniceicoccales bacterium CK1056]|uniref:Glycine cleavage system H protein n=1 Tax=Oceanipulchritudo coccoides TaxID=2706888 RepID=A0A6B2M1B2_9BACT|nr:glycine cleavage system protein GcvH [Oceanipulchritudo coccoides]NDV61857.1 glycine cleavage system protein GcvH [Oceanipulchritudo coccoides]